MFDMRIFLSLSIIVCVILTLYHENNKLKKQIKVLPKKEINETFTVTSSNINDVVNKFKELKQQVQHVIQTNIEYMGKYATQEGINEQS